MKPSLKRSYDQAKLDTFQQEQLYKRSLKKIKLSDFIGNMNHKEKIALQNLLKADLDETQSEGHNEIKSPIFRKTVSSIKSRVQKNKKKSNEDHYPKSYEDLKDITKLTEKAYTIHHKKKYERWLECKEKSCKARARIITFYETGETYQWLSLIDHHDNCKFKDLFGRQDEDELIFDDLSFKLLVASTLAPKNVIQTFNKQRESKCLPKIDKSNKILKKQSKVRYQ